MAIRTFNSQGPADGGSQGSPVIGAGALPGRKCCALRLRSALEQLAASVGLQHPPCVKEGRSRRLQGGLSAASFSFRKALYFSVCSIQSLSLLCRQLPLHKGAFPRRCLPLEGAGLRGRPLPKAEAPTEPAGETGGVRSGSNEVVPQKSSCYRRSSAPSLCKGGWHPKDDGRIVCTKPVIRKHQEKGRESAVESAPRSFLMNLLCSVATIPQSASQTASRLPARSALLNASVQRSSPKIRALYTRELSHTANPERGPRKIEAIGYP